MKFIDVLDKVKKLGVSAAEIRQVVTRGDGYIDLYKLLENKNTREAYQTAIGI